MDKRDAAYLWDMLQAIDKIQDFVRLDRKLGKWIHRLSGLLNPALGYELQLPERRAANLEAGLSACPSLEFIIDRAERPINRPKDKEKQKSHYSRKKKQHAVKNNVVTERGGKVVYLSGTCEGKRHEAQPVSVPARLSRAIGLPQRD